MKKKYQQGISLLEVLLSLSIIAIILIMATRYFFMATDNSRLNQARAQIGAVMAAATGWETEHADVSGLTVTTLLEDRFLARTKDVIGAQGSEELISPWKTPVTLVADSSSDGRAISLVVPNKEVCARLASAFSGASCDDNTIVVPLSDDNA
ncbi:MAG: hypothetical protein A3F17_02135 [Gammaproteobacteria bacterium RIFCSPHIGHO2_12_FULL_41_15]|nr:MAG: hypothetical protein A3F17_02135 [Gammaproteobacteria bacterium RIFCSPHIGHO2_12_FULL_41_15]